MKQKFLPTIKWSEQTWGCWAIRLRSDLLIALTKHFFFLLLDKILPSSSCSWVNLGKKVRSILFKIRSVTIPNYSTKVYHLHGSNERKWLWHFILNVIVFHNGRFTFKTKSREFMMSLMEHRIHQSPYIQINVLIGGTEGCIFW